MITHAGGEDQQAAAVFMRLMVTWLTQCEASVATFMGNSANIPFIVDIITARYRQFCPSYVLSWSPFLDERPFRLLCRVS